VTQGFISKIENGRLKPTVEFIEKACQALEVSASEQVELVGMTKAFLISFSRWGAGFNSLSELQDAASERQSNASRIEVYMANLFVGFMQTEGYARALFEAYSALKESPMSQDELDTAVHARVRQSEILRNVQKEITVVVGEAALAEWLFGPAVHAAQLDHVLGLIEQHKLDFRILPFQRSAGLQPMGSFIVFDRKLVEYEAQTRCFHFWEAEEVSVYTRLFDKIVAQSVAGADVQRMLEYYGDLAQGALDRVRSKASPCA
jgi:predicted transcriptional regulator